MVKFNPRSIREIGEYIVGDKGPFPYRSSSKITEFFEDCGLDFCHNGDTRRLWAADRVKDLLADPTPQPYILPERLTIVLRTLLDPAEVVEGDEERIKAFEQLNATLSREGFVAFYDENRVVQFRHIETKKVSMVHSPHRPLSQTEKANREQLSNYLDSCSEDELTEKILLPMFKQLGFHRVTLSGHKDKLLEYGKDVWMKFTLPTMHVLYFGIQVKKGKLDAAGKSAPSSSNIAEILNQSLMMLGHEIFDPEPGRNALVDHAIIIAGGEITKQAKNWLGERLDQSKRSQILFMDKDDILNLYITSGTPLPPESAPPAPPVPDDIPF